MISADLGITIQALLRTINQILNAGIAITAFSLLLYALTFNLHDRTARSFAGILVSIVIIFTAETIGSTTELNMELDFWFRIQWIGIIFLPSTYFHFSDALLTTTGKPSRGRRKIVSRVAYFISTLFVIGLLFFSLAGPVIINQDPTPHLKPSRFSNSFSIFFICMLLLSGYNLFRAYQRTTTPTSQRRMAYLIAGSIATTIGSFPYLLYASGFASKHSIIFWATAVIASILVGTMLVVMAYGVSFFGASYPDRIIKSRLFRWIMRGPVTASLTLALTTIVRRYGAHHYGSDYTALVPIIMVANILICEYLITLFHPIWENLLFYGSDRKNLELVDSLQERLLTINDLQQFLELILASICDRLQAGGAYLIILESERMDIFVQTGKPSIEEWSSTNELTRIAYLNGNHSSMFKWGEDTIIPIYDNAENQSNIKLLGLIGISGIMDDDFDEEQTRALKLLIKRTTNSLRDYYIQDSVMNSLQVLTPQMDLFQRMSAASRFDRNNLLESDSVIYSQDMTQWVKDALSHFWGGPKLTESPLMNLQIVQDATELHKGNNANALRYILREAIEKVRPEGEQHLTGEWILYNILEMKFLQGRKVREIARKLAMSEADLYRKQRIAIEAVSTAILEMETISQHQKNTA